MDSLMSLETSFIHSFILNIYIAPLQENNSEALPTPARSNKAVLRREKNAGEVVLLKMRSSEGRPFQVEGPTTEKARICLVKVRAKGTRRGPCWDERSDRELIALRGGQQSSRMQFRRLQEQGQLSSARPRKRSCMKSDMLSREPVKDIIVIVIVNVVVVFVIIITIISTTTTTINTNLFPRF